MEKHEDAMFSEQIRKIAEEAMEGAMERMAAEAESEAMFEALEAEKSDPDALLLGAMEDICDLISCATTEVEEWGASTAQLIEINRSVADLANTAMRIRDRLTEGKTLEKLRFMRSVEEQNDESIRKWSDQQ